LAIHDGKSLKGEDVVGVMEWGRVLGKRLPVCIHSQMTWLRLNSSKVSGKTKISDLALQ